MQTYGAKINSPTSQQPVTNWATGCQPVRTHLPFFSFSLNFSAHCRAKKRPRALPSPTSCLSLSFRELGPSTGRGSRSSQCLALTCSTGFSSASTLLGHASHVLVLPRHGLAPGVLASWLRLNSNWERFTAAEGAIRNRNAYFYPIPVFGSAIILTSGEGNALKGRLPAGVLPMHWYLVFELGRCFLSPTNNQPLGLSCGGSFLGCFVAHFQILST
jgi:hypothetical protein